MSPVRTILKLSAALLMAVAVNGVFAADFNEGIEYKDVPVEGPRDGKTIEVLEFYYYGCPHCDSLEPSLVAWKKNLGDDVHFERIPAPLNPRWTLFARAYYAAEALGVAEKGHQALFDAIHRQEKKFSGREELADFWAQYGADKEKLLALMGDFNLDRTKVRRAISLARRYGLEGVPSLIIDGRWRTSPSMVGSNETALEVASDLIEKARQLNAVAGAK